MRLKILFYILLCALILAAALTPAQALTPRLDIPVKPVHIENTQIRIYEYPSTLQEGERLNMRFHLTYANGSEITVNYMDYITVHTYINGKKTHGFVLCNATGHSGSSDEIETTGITEVQVRFIGSTHRRLAPSVSSTYLVNVHGPDQHQANSGSYMLDLISYAKGFFALSFFGTLFGAIGLGCMSVLSNDPEKKAASQNRLFFIGKVLLTVTLLFMAVLFVAP